MNANESNQENPILKYYHEWATSTPAISRLSVLAMLWIYFLSWFVDLDKCLGNITYFSVFQLELYRIVFSPFVGNSFINVIFLLLFYPDMAKCIELAIGSAAFLVLLGTLSIATNLVFNLVCLVGWVLGMKAMIIVTCSGFWLVVFSLMVLECMNNPNYPRTLLCIPVQFPSRYFPIVLYILFCIFSGPQLDLACALGVGYLYSQNYFDRLKLSSNYLADAESSGILQAVATNLSYWVSAASASEYGVSQDIRVDDNTNREQQLTLSGTYASPFSKVSSKSDLFPGAGQVMGKSSNQPTLSAWLPPVMESAHATAPSREEVASRRLVALSDHNTNTSRRHFT